MSRCTGGQRRTIEISCGWRCIGHPNEVNKKLARHERYCPSCSQHSTIKLEPFNKEASKMNGWDGLTAKGQKPTQMSTNAISNGQEYLNIMSNANCLEHAVAKTNQFLEQIETIPTVPQLSKSQKKRQKEKAKKQRNNEKE